MLFFIQDSLIHQTNFVSFATYCPNLVFEKKSLSRRSVQGEKTLQMCEKCMPELASYPQKFSLSFYKLPPQHLHFPVLLPFVSIFTQKVRMERINSHPVYRGSVPFLFLLLPVGCRVSSSGCVRPARQMELEYNPVPSDLNCYYRGQTFRELEIRLSHGNLLRC